MPNRTEIVFQQPLFQSERIATNWQNMRASITSPTRLEAALTALQQETAPANLNLSTADAQQALDLYNAAVTDGRYLKDLMTEPADVASKLGMPLSTAAERQIKLVGNTRVLQPGGPVESPVEVVCVAVIVLVLAKPAGIDPQEQVVIDSSGIVKI